MSDLALPSALAGAAREGDRIGRGEAVAAWLLTAPAIIAFVLMLLVRRWPWSPSPSPTTNWAPVAQLHRPRQFRRTAGGPRLRHLLPQHRLLRRGDDAGSVIGGLALALAIEGGTARANLLPRRLLPACCVAHGRDGDGLPVHVPPDHRPGECAAARPRARRPELARLLRQRDVDLSIIGVWEQIGFNMVLFLAGLTAIPRDLYAAARWTACARAGRASGR